MKIIKFVPNWLKCQENRSEISFGILDTPPNLGRRYLGQKFKIVPNWPKWLKKLVRNNFENFGTPLPPLHQIGDLKNLSNEKIKVVPNWTK